MSSWRLNLIGTGPELLKMKKKKHQQIRIVTMNLNQFPHRWKIIYNKNHNHENTRAIIISSHIEILYWWAREDTGMFSFSLESTLDLANDLNFLFIHSFHFPHEYSPNLRTRIYKVTNYSSMHSPGKCYVLALCVSRYVYLRDFGKSEMYHAYFFRDTLKTLFYDNTGTALSSVIDTLFHIVFLRAFTGK